jgi:hypothetical protein
MIVLSVIVISSLLAQATPPDIGVEEIIFSSRQGGAGSHWYENFGYYSQDENTAPEVTGMRTSGTTPRTRILSSTAPWGACAA